MTDAIQALLIIVITVLTAILTVIGVQFVHILKEFRKTAGMINKILADAERVTNQASNSFVELAGITSGIKSVLGFFNLFSKRNKTKEIEDEE